MVTRSTRLRQHLIDGRHAIPFSRTLAATAPAITASDPATHFFRPANPRVWRRVRGQDALAPKVRLRVKIDGSINALRVLLMRAFQSAEDAGSPTRTEHGAGPPSERGLGAEGVSPSHAPQGAAVRAAHACPPSLRACRRVRGQDALAPKGPDFEPDHRSIHVTRVRPTPSGVEHLSGEARGRVAGFGNALRSWTSGRRCVGCVSLGPRCGRPWGRRWGGR